MRKIKSKYFTKGMLRYSVLLEEQRHLFTGRTSRDIYRFPHQILLIFLCIPPIIVNKSDKFPARQIINNVIIIYRIITILIITERI